LREAQAMAREVLADLRGVNFSFTTLAILISVADERLIPGVVETRRLTAAWARWDKAGLRQARLSRRLPKRATLPRAF
jgi:hypothetical protein